MPLIVRNNGLSQKIIYILQLGHKLWSKFTDIIQGRMIVEHKAIEAERIL